MDWDDGEDGQAVPAHPLRPPGPSLPFAIGFVVLSVGLFVWFWPTLTGGPLSDEAFRLRAWFPSWT